MKKRMAVALALAFGGAGLSGGATLYVATNGTHDVANKFDTWLGAATNIHEAVALAVATDTVRVSNGVFRLTNQLTIAAAFTVRSENGPGVTTLYRDAAAGQFRLFDVASAGAWVEGFTLTNGYTSSGAGSVNMTAGTVSNCVVFRGKASGDNPSVAVSGGVLSGCTITNCSGGNFGHLFVSGSGVAEDCVIASCSAQIGGVRLAGSGLARRCRIFNNTGSYGAGGVFFFWGGKLHNSLVYKNTGTIGGGGVYMNGGGELYNCTIAGNTYTAGAGDGVGSKDVIPTIRNCVMYGNGDNTASENFSGNMGNIRYSCSPGLTNGVNGNVNQDPVFVSAIAYDYRLALGSPCLDTGSNYVSITDDIDRRTRPLAADSRGVLRHDMGAFEKDGQTGPLEIGFSGAPLSGLESVETVFAAAVAGSNRTIAWWGWDFDTDGIFDRTGADLGTVTNVFGPGLYSVTVLATNAIGETATVTKPNYVLVPGSNIYVAVSGKGIVPYTTWENAATSLHEAVTVAGSGATVWLADGPHRLTNQVTMNAAFTIRSENGPQATTVYRAAGYGNFRLFQLLHADAVLAGLTLTNGAVSSGAGAISVSAGTVSNCAISRCSGASVVELTAGLLIACGVSNSSGSAGAVFAGGSAVVEDCVITGCSGTDAGGLRLANSGVARRCRITGNSGSGYGPGGVYFAWGGRMEDSLIVGNTGGSGSSVGAGVVMDAGTVMNCTVASNSVAGNVRDGAYAENYAGPTTSVAYSCAPELTPGEQGNLASDPQFKDAPGGNYRLASGSPCRNAGYLYGSVSSLDLDRQPRVQEGAVEMGAYELAPPAGTLIVVR